MRARVPVVILSLALPHAARAELVKPNGMEAARTPGLLALETREAEPVRAGRVMRAAWGSCTASVVDLPGAGPRVVTARHCRGAELRLRDETAARDAGERRDADGEVDVALLAPGAPLPWPAIPARASSTVAIGERLCAVRVEPAPRGLVREPICARLLHRVPRDGAPPLLVLGHPFPHGTSGSPLLDAAGRAVGVVVATTDVAGIAEPIEAAVALAGAEGAASRPH